MTSTVSRGSYYKRKTKVWFEKQGYTVQLTEFVCGRMIGQGKIIYQKVDVFGSDGIAMNGKEIIFWNSKHATTPESFRVVKSEGKKEYRKYPFPSFVKRQLIIWEPRKQPVIVEVDK